MKDKKILAIALCCIVAAIGAYAVSGSGSTPATIKGVAGAGTFWAAGIPDYSGIENIYIVDINQGDWNIDFGTYDENVLGVITGTGLSADIPYDTEFAIVVAVKGHDDNMAYVVKENLTVQLEAHGSFDIELENSDGNEYVFAESAGVYIRVNCVWDNSAAGYTLPAGGSILLDPVKLWTWS